MPGLYALVLMFSNGIGYATSLNPAPDFSYSWDACQQAGKVSKNQNPNVDFICVPKLNTIVRPPEGAAPSKDRFYPNG
jgi:hypothetical protein